MWPITLLSVREASPVSWGGEELATIVALEPWSTAKDSRVRDDKENDDKEEEEEGGGGEYRLGHPLLGRGYQVGGYPYGGGGGGEGLKVLAHEVSDSIGG